MDLFAASVRHNPTIDFYIVCDQPQREHWPRNLGVINTTFEEYVGLASAVLGVKLPFRESYRLCEIRPMIGEIHKDLVEPYDFWGYGDLDVVYGDIRRFIGEDELTHDVISSHAHVVSGHFTLVRNTPRMNGAFRRILHWRYLITRETRRSFDERIFSLLFIGDSERRKRGVHRFLAPRLGGALLREQYSTCIKGLKWVDGSEDYPKRWYWRSGRLTTDNTADREFMYCHFTHWASGRWNPDGRAPWAGIDPLNRVPHDAGAFAISATGFDPL